MSPAHTQPQHTATENVGHRAGAHQLTSVTGRGAAVVAVGEVVELAVVLRGTCATDVSRLVFECEAVALRAGETGRAALADRAVWGDPWELW